jgi:hypothetical protein
MADYQLTAAEEPCIVILTEEGGSVWHIPPDQANRHYAEYLQWVDDGGVPDPYVEPEPVPDVPTAAEQLAFDHENRILALEGQPPLTVDDFVQKVTAMSEAK